jgi:pilus assembly protein CpaC
LSGETASFLAGGEFPIPVSQSLGSITIEYKQYGVGLAFTPIVLADGRISMRVRPEVSELSNEGAVRLNNFLVPSLTTRRAETTVELGAGQSFMIGGLLRNRVTNTVEKAPFLGDLPILGSLFRSTAYRRDETELVIIVTPYLVRPASGQLALPIDGYRVPAQALRDHLGQKFLVLDHQHPHADLYSPRTCLVDVNPFVPRNEIATRERLTAYQKPHPTRRFSCFGPPPGSGGAPLPPPPPSPCAPC